MELYIKISIISILFQFSSHAFIYAKPLSLPFITKTHISSTNAVGTTTKFLQPETAKTIVKPPPLSHSEEPIFPSNLNNQAYDSTQCPMNFKLGINSNPYYHDHDIYDRNRNSAGIQTPPLIAPTNIGEDPNHLEIWYTTNYEHLDKLVTTTTSNNSNKNVNTPLYKEDSKYSSSGMFPLLFESSSFQYTSPIHYDFNADGKEDIIIVESNREGRIFVINGDTGMKTAHGTKTNNKDTNSKKEENPILLDANRAFANDIRIPSLFLATNWYIEDDKINNPNTKFRSYTTSIDYLYREQEGKQQKGISADILHQDPHIRDTRNNVLQERNEQHQTRLQKARSLNKEIDQEDIDDEEMKRIASLLILESKLMTMNEGDEISSKENASNVGTSLDNEKMDRVKSMVALEAMFEQKAQMQNDEELMKHVASLLVVESKILEGEGLDQKTNVEEKQSDIQKNMETNSFDPSQDHPFSPISQNNKNIENDMDEMPYYPDYFDDMYDHENMFQDDVIPIDPHVLATPVVVEIKKYKYSKKNTPLLVVPVSYYFDEREYSHREENHHESDLDNIEKRQRYAASALLMYDIQSDYWLPERLLDISTRESNNIMGEGAFIHTTPTIVDLDNDKFQDIIVGTSMGFIYALDLMTLEQKPGFPVQMHAPIHAQIMAVDMINSFEVELVSVDMKGNVACLSHTGLIIWSVNLGLDVEAAGGLALGDVDGDGNLDIVCISYHRSVRRDENSDSYYVGLHVLSGASGQALKNFPKFFPVSTPIHDSSPQPPLLIDLHSSQSHWLRRLRNSTSITAESLHELKALAEQSIQESSTTHGGNFNGLHIVTTTADGYIYMIEGSSGCTNRLTTGEALHATPLAEDLHGNGKMGLILATSKTGEIITMESIVDYHSLNSFRGGGGSGNLDSGTNVHGYSSKIGIILSEYSSEFRHIVGFEIPVTFEIFDIRKNVPENVSYNVEIRVGSHIDGTVFTKEYFASGIYTEKINIPRKPHYYTLFIKLIDENGIRYEDTFKIGYNIRIYHGLEWLVLLPLFLAAIPLLLFTGKGEGNVDAQGLGILG